MGLRGIVILIDQAQGRAGKIKMEAKKMKFKKLAKIRIDKGNYGRFNPRYWWRTVSLSIDLDRDAGRKVSNYIHSLIRGQSTGSEFCGDIYYLDIYFYGPGFFQLLQGLKKAGYLVGYSR